MRKKLKKIMCKDHKYRYRFHHDVSVRYVKECKVCSYTNYGDSYHSFYFPKHIHHDQRGKYLKFLNKKNELL